MTKAAIEGLRSEQARALELMTTLTPEEWSAASGCDGWRVQDVVQHMASVFHGIADPTSIERGESHDVEQNAEVPVQARKDWSSGEVVAEYQEWSNKGIGALAGMQDPPMAEMVVPIGNLGSHPNLSFTELGTTASVCPGDDGGLWVVSAGGVDGLPTASGSAHDFVSWATKRSDWRSSWTLEADNANAESTLDAFNVI